MTASGDQVPDPIWGEMIQKTRVVDDNGIDLAANIFWPYGATSCGAAFPAGRAVAPGPNEGSPNESVAGGGALSPAGGA